MIFNSSILLCLQPKAGCVIDNAIMMSKSILSFLMSVFEKITTLAITISNYYILNVTFVSFP